MARFGIIENGIVVNLAAADAEFAAAQGWVEVPAGVGIGWLYDGEIFAPGEPDLAVLVEANVARAKAALVESDWSDLLSVRNTAIEPHLLNGADFDTYRAALRSIVVNRPAKVAVWPVRPDAVWS